MQVKDFLAEKLNDTEISNENKELLKRYNKKLVKELADINIEKINNIVKNTDLVLHLQIYYERKNIENELSSKKDYSELENDKTMSDIIKYIITRNLIVAQAEALNSFYQNTKNNFDSETAKNNFFKIIVFSESLFIDNVPLLAFSGLRTTIEPKSFYKKLKKNSKYNLSEEKKLSIYEVLEKEVKEFENKIIKHKNSFVKNSRSKFKSSRLSVKDLTKLNQDTINKLNVEYNKLWNYFLNKVEYNAYLEPIFLNLDKEGLSETRNLSKDQINAFIDAYVIGPQAITTKHYVINYINKTLNKKNSTKSIERKKFDYFSMLEYGKAQLSYLEQKKYLPKIIELKLASYEKISKLTKQ